MDFNSDNSSQNITLPTIGVVDKVLYTSVFSNNLISNLPITSGILTASNITASSNISIAGSLLQTNAACNIYIAGNVGIGTTIGTLNSNLNIFGTVNINSNLNAVSIFENGLSLTNKYQSNILANLTYQILRYPPVTLTSASTTLTGNSYGNGIYITSASSVAFGLGTYDSFTYPYTFGGWACTNSRYSSTYLGTVSTSITSIGNILGEWLQIQLPISIKLNSYAILSSSQFKSAPSTWYLVGSTNQTTWYPIDYRTNITNWTINTSANQFIPNGANASSNYNYFRIIVTNVIGGVVLQIGQISLYSIYETIPSSATITTTNIGIGTTILNYPTSFSVVSGTSYFKNSIGIGTVPYNTSLLTISSTDSNNETIIVNNTNNQFGKCSINFNNSNFNAYIGIGGTGYTFQKYSSNLYIETTYSILFNAFGNNYNSIPSMVVSGISNVGIGTTTAGTNCLAVYGTSNYFSGSMGIGIAPSGTAGDLKLATMTASGAVTIGGAASLTNNLSVSGTSTLIGNVGIGTNVTNSPLQFNNSLSSGLRIITLYQSTNNNYNFIGLGIGNGLLFQISDNVNDAFKFQVANSPSGGSSSVELMRINGNGSVGIGTASVTAGAKLQVYGGPIYALGIGISGDGNTGNPSTNAMGGNGDRIILWPGNNNAGGQPFSLGIGAGTMWYSVPAGNVHRFYVGGNQAILIDSNCNLTASGDLSLTRTNASITFVTNGYNIAVPSTANFFSSNALANDMVIRSTSNLMLQSGGSYAAIYINTSNNVGIGTASITTGAKLQVNGGPIFAAGVYPSVSGPTNGQMGGNGDRIVLWPGGPSEVPFSLGINSSNMWYSVPTSCTHIFYIGGNQAILIDSNCNLTVTCNILTNNKISIGSTNIFNANTLLTISSTNTANDTVVINNTLAAGTGKCSINFNNSNINAYIGVGGTSTNFSNYTSNLYIQADKSIIFNINGSTSNNSNPVMLLSSNNYVSVNDLWLNGQSIFYNNGEKQFPPRIYDSAPSIASTNTNVSLFPTSSPSGTSVYTETLTYNGIGTYILYYSSINTNVSTTLKQNLFDYKYPPASGYTLATWASGNYTSGTANANSCIKDISNNQYNGDWIVIKFPSTIILTRFRFYTDSSSSNLAPAAWYCLGSMDGINFNLIQNATNTTNVLTSNSYNISTNVALYYYEYVVSPSIITPYNYIGFVINKLTSTTIQLSIAELQIFGIDSISTSLLNTWNESNYINYLTNSSSTVFVSSNTTFNTVISYQFQYNSRIKFNRGTEIAIPYGYTTITINPTNYIGKIAITGASLLPEINDNYSYPLLYDTCNNYIAPILWYKFDNSLINSGTYTNNDLTATNSPEFDFINYVKGASSILFATSNNTPAAVAQYLTINNSSNINFSNINLATGITFSFWVWTGAAIGSSGSYARFFDFGEQIVGGGSSNYISCFRNGTDASNIIFEIKTNNIANNTSNNLVTTTATWRFITWSISSSGTWNIYINASNIYTAINKGTIPTFQNTLASHQFNKSKYTADGSFYMNLDDFRVYATVLTSNQIYELYNSRIEIYQVAGVGIGTSTVNDNILNINGSIGLGTTATGSIGDFKCLTLTSSNVQSNYYMLYPPPYIFTTSPQTITSSYGSGQYTLTASSYISSVQAPWLAFNFPVSNSNAWVCGQYASAYPYNSGASLNRAYLNSGGATCNTAVIVSSLSASEVTSNIRGEWLQIQLPTSIILTSYSITGPQTPLNKRSPSSWYLAGSIDNIKWYLIDNRTNINNWGSYANTTNTYSNINFTRNTSMLAYSLTPYNYYRIIITTVYNDPAVCIVKFGLYGYQNIPVSVSTNSIGIGTTSLSYGINSLSVYNGYSYFANNVGIGTNIPLQELHVQSPTPSMIRVETNVSAPDQVSGIEFGIPAFISNYSAKITSTSIAGNKANLQFYTPDGTNPSAVRLTITDIGTTLNNSVGIGTTVSATYGLDIWFNSTNAVRIGNTTTVSTNNGYLILSGGTGGSAGSGSLGFINFHTSNGTRQGYIGYGINTTNYIDLATENSFLGYRVNSNLLIGNKLGIGTTSILTNIKVGIYGGVVNITNNTPFAGTGNNMQAGSLIIGDTLLDYGNSTNWSSNTAGLLFECSNNTEIVVHDNATRLASLIQYLGDTSNRIIIGRDMGWGAISNIRLSSTTSIINGLTGFPSFGSNGSSGDKLVLWPGDATNYPYSIGIAGATMWFGVPSGAKYHFYINSSNTPAVTIDSNSNFSTAGYIYAGGTTSGLRINGNDWGNTIYQNATGIGTNPANIGFTLRDNNSFNFWSYSTAATPTYTLMAVINMNNISLLRTVGIGTTASFNANTLLTISSTNTLSNTVVINNTASAGNGKCSINFNNNNINAYIGLGGSSTGLAAFYNCNLLIQSDNAIVFSAFNTSPAATPPLMINSSGGIGIGTTSCNISGLACALFVNGNYSYFVGNVGIGTNPSTNSVYPGGNLNAVSILENGLALTNKYQSFVNATYSNLNNQYQYPPASLTSSSTTLSGNVYGNFTYTVSASSSFSGNGPEKAFQYPNVYFWNINTPYPYTGAGAGSLKSYALTTYGTSNIVNYSNIIYGEWIQIQYQNPIVLQSYSITGISGISYTRAPATWYLLGSVNTSNWYPIDFRSNITNWVSAGTTNTYSGFATAYNGPFNYYRIVVTQTAGDSGLAINQIIFNGYETNVVSTLRLYPPTSMNSSNTSISAQTYGNGTYIATQSSTYPSQLFFNTVSTTNNGQWTSAGNLYNASGIYTGDVSTTVNGTAYIGEWCQIILPVPIILTYYTLRSSTTGSGNNYNYSMFRKWILIGSNDGANWTILDSRISITWNLYESRSFSVTANYEYLSYYRIIILETNSSPVAGQIVLAGFYLYGFENLKSILTGPVGINTYPTLNNALTIGGYIGIGTTNANASIEIYSTNQLNAGLILSGQEYGSAPSVGNYTAGGIALLCGINISGNKQLWVTDSKNVGLNTSTAKAIRLICSTSVDNSIDCVGLDNATIKPIIFGNTGAITSIYGSGIYMNGSVGIGTAANSSYALSVFGAINLTSNPSNPGNNTSASFWNQANVGPTISGSAVSFQVNGTTEMARITSTNTIFYNNIGLGTTPPVGDKARLLVYEATGRDAAASGGGSLVLQHGNSGGVSSIVFASTVNYASDFGYIKFYDNVQGTGFNYFGGISTETAALVIGCENDGSSGAGPDSVILNPIGSVAIVPGNGVTYIAGSVGIGNTSPKLTLDVGYTNANHNIGRAILTAGDIHAADKLDFLSIGRWDGSSTANWQFCGIKCGVITGAAAGESANNHSCITFHTWGNSVANSREVMRITSRGVLSGGVNVFKKIIFTFTPSYSSSPAGYYYYINISSYISSFVGGAGNNQFIFRMTISSTSGDFGDSGNNVNTISYNVFLAAWGGGGKCRIYQVLNSSSEAYLTWFDVQGTGAYQVYFWGGSNGGARYCILENIGTY